MEIDLTGYCDRGKLVENAVCVKKLKPVYEDVKSYYNKAIVYEMPGGVEVLCSYKIPVVALINGELVKLQKDNDRTTSHTTMRHINEYMMQHGQKKYPVKKWRKVIAV